MEINKVREEKIVPQWANKNNYSSLENESNERLSKLASKNLNEQRITEELDLVEKCAGTKSSYHYNTAWGEEAVSKIKEYAEIVGLDKSKVVAVENAQNIIKASSSQMIKTASLDEKLQSIWGDPFHFDRHSDMTHMNKKDTQELTKQSMLKDRPDVDGKSVIAIRGGENYNSNSDIRNAPGTNSMVSPNAIEEMINNKVEDTGVRLGREREERENQKRVDHENWQKDVISAMTKNDIVPKGSVFHTESLFVQPGLNTPSSQMGIYSKFDKNNVPDKTAGESIKEQNSERKKSIQRAEKNDEWQTPSHQASAKISDSFSESLKKHLGK